MLKWRDARTHRNELALEACGSLPMPLERSHNRIEICLGAPMLLLTFSWAASAGMSSILSVGDWAGRPPGSDREVESARTSIVTCLPAAPAMAIQGPGPALAHRSRPSPRSTRSGSAPGMTAPRACSRPMANPKQRGAQPPPLDDRSRARARRGADRARRRCRRYPPTSSVLRTEQARGTEGSYYRRGCHPTPATTAVLPELERA